MAQVASSTLPSGSICAVACSVPRRGAARQEGVAPCCYFLGRGKHEECVVGSLGGVEGSVEIAVGDVEELKGGLEAIGAACRISKMKK